MVLTFQTHLVRRDEFHFKIKNASMLSEVIETNSVNQNSPENE